MTDPEFIGAVHKLGLELDPLTGAEIQKIIDHIMSFPPTVGERALAAKTPD